MLVIADVLQHGEVSDVLVPKGHPEPRALQFGDELGEAFQLLVIHHVHVPGADRLEIEFDLAAHRRGLDPLAVLPVPRGRSHFADVDFRVEVGGEMLAVNRRRCNRGCRAGGWSSACAS